MKRAFNAAQYCVTDTKLLVIAKILVMQFKTLTVAWILIARDDIRCNMSRFLVMCAVLQCYVQCGHILA